MWGTANKSSKEINNDNRTTAGFTAERMRWAMNQEVSSSTVGKMLDGMRFRLGAGDVRQAGQNESEARMCDIFIRWHIDFAIICRVLRYESELSAIIFILLRICRL